MSREINIALAITSLFGVVGTGLIVGGLVIEGIVAFGCMVILGLVELGLEFFVIKKYPDIAVRVEKEIRYAGETFLLKVFNKGTKGVLKANVRILTGKDEIMVTSSVERYDLYWEKSKRDLITLMNSEEGTLKIATCIASDDGLAHYLLHYYEGDNREMYESCLVHRTVDWDIKNREYALQPIRLRITITSDPMMEKTFTKDYILSGKGLLSAT